MKFAGVHSDNTSKTGPWKESNTRITPARLRQLIDTHQFEAKVRFLSVSVCWYRWRTRARSPCVVL